MIIKVTKLQYLALNNLSEVIDEMADKIGINPIVIEDWGKDSTDYLSARNYFRALQVAYFNGRPCESILESISKNIEIIED